MERELLAANLERVRRELAEAAEGRWPVPRLVAVTKTPWEKTGCRSSGRNSRPCGTTSTST